MVLGQISDIWGPESYIIHPIKNLQNSDLHFVALFNSNFDSKTLCESGVVWIIRFVTLFSISLSWKMSPDSQIPPTSFRHLVIAVFSLRGHVTIERLSRMILTAKLYGHQISENWPGTIRATVPHLKVTVLSVTQI